MRENLQASNHPRETAWNSGNLFPLVPGLYVGEYLSGSMCMKVISMSCRNCLGLLVVSTVFIAILLFLGGCSTHGKHQRQPELASYRQTGKASFYAMKYQFRKTANGERFNNYSMTAAHKTLPFGTWVIVTNLSNHKSVKVRINDRGPFVKGRIIDLTRAAFAKIESIDKGITEVEIRVVD